MRRTIGPVLTGAAAFLLITGALLHFYVAPRMTRAPANVYAVTTMRAENATYLDASTAKVRTGATVTSTTTVRGDPAAGHGRIAVWESFTATQDLANDTTLSYARDRIAFDRSSAQLVNCCDASIDGHTGVPMSGIGKFWPMNVEKKTYMLFDIPTQRAWPVTYQGEERVGGLRTYRFVQRVPDTIAPGEVPAVPASMLGMKGNAPTPVQRHHQGEATYWIDPRTGAPVNVRQKVHSTLVAKQGPGRLVVADMDLRMTEDGRRKALAQAKNGRWGLLALTTLAPIACLLLGLALLATALITARTRTPHRH
ncbi:DUF3068 domain-containing protein [Actinomadura rugatobispora]|uniref:DUF3068 domain-containing protein n=1 Tax=Actinomadura rugatobispora TaxID=1994 RepID=A0ABW1A7P7_9ACTN|nr:DUF3068 domain-containing protein [Actinomadura rugatobispora]